VGHAPWGAGLRGASTHFIQLFKTFLNKYFDLNMAKNFLKNKKKSCKIAAASVSPRTHIDPRVVTVTY